MFKRAVRPFEKCRLSCGRDYVNQTQAGAALEEDSLSASGNVELGQLNVLLWCSFAPLRDQAPGGQRRSRCHSEGRGEKLRDLRVDPRSFEQLHQRRRLCQDRGVQRGVVVRREKRGVVRREWDSALLCLLEFLRIRSTEAEHRRGHACLTEFGKVIRSRARRIQNHIAVSELSAQSSRDAIYQFG